MTYVVGVLIGSVVSLMATEWARNNIADIEMQGADALYAGAGSFISLTLLPKKWGFPIALGMMAGGLSVAAEEMGVF